MINLKDKKDCCGCTACSSICARKAISFYEDKEGFLYPKVNKQQCVDCGLCIKVCPVTYYRDVSKKADPVVYAAINKDREEYLSSSSGGIFIVLANQVVSEGGIVVGASYDADWHVVHTIAETKEECKKFQKSKYVQSDIRGIFKQIKDYLLKGRKVLFSGTPCQVAGLKLFLMKPYRNLITVDIVCHGVPSPKIYHEYLNFVSKGSAIKTLDFKTKNTNNHSTCLSIELEDGTRFENRLITRVWNKLQFSNCIERPSCYDCQFSHLNRPADITIGDYWHYSKHSAAFFPNRAPSLVLLNTDAGKQLFDMIQERLHLEQSDTKTCLQPNLMHPTKESIHRSVFWEAFEDMSFKSLISVYADYTIKNRIKDFVTHSLFINKSIKRIVYRQYQNK